MFTPLIIAFCVFAIILVGAFAGAVVRRYVPQHHLSEETKSVVSISMAVLLRFLLWFLGSYFQTRTARSAQSRDK